MGPEVPVDDLPEGLGAEVPENDLPSAAPTAAPEDWVTVRGPRPKKSLAYWLNPFPSDEFIEQNVQGAKQGLTQGRGFTGSVLEAAGRTPSATEEDIGKFIIDPAVGGATAGLQLPFAAMPFAEQISKGIGAVDEWAAPKIASLFGGDPERTLNPEPVADVGATMGADVKAALTKHVPSLTITALGGKKAISKGAAPEIAFELPKQTPKAVRLFQTVVKPPTGTKFSRNFPESGANGLRQIVEEAPKTNDPMHNARTGFSAAEKRLGSQKEAMTEYGDQRGGKIKLESAADAAARIGKDDFFDLIDTDGAKVFDSIASKIKPETVSVRRGADLYSMIEKQLRKMRQAAGDRAAQLETNEKFQAWDAVRKNLGAQLNEVASRRPNEWIENSRDFSDLYNTMEGIERNFEVFSKDPANVKTWRDMASMKGAKDFLMEMGLKRNMLTDLQQSLNMGKSKPLPLRAPMGPQKPSSLPGRTSAPRGEVTEFTIPRIEVPPALLEKFQLKQSMLAPPGSVRTRLPPMQMPKGIDIETLIRNAEGEPVPERPMPSSRLPPMESFKLPTKEPPPPVENFKIAGGMSPEAAPVKAIPTWVDTIQKRTQPSNAEKFRLAQHAQKIISGKSKVTYGEALADPKIHKWEKDVLQELAKKPESAEAVLMELSEQLRKKVHPF